MPILRSARWWRKTSVAGGAGDDSLYGGGGADRGGDLAVTADGGLILTGYTNSMGEGGNDIYLVKLAADGTVEWENAYGSAANDRGNAVIQTPDDGYLVAGRRRGRRRLPQRGGAHYARARIGATGAFGRSHRLVVAAHRARTRAWGFPTVCVAPR